MFRFIRQSRIGQYSTHSVIATRLSYLIEAESLLPPMHVKGCRGMLYDIALYNIIMAIYRAFKKDKRATLLLLNVSGAFNNILYLLLYNLKN